MKRLNVVSGWHGTGASAEDAIRPRIASDYALDGWSDRSGKSGQELLASGGIVQVRCSDAVALAMAADPKYAGRISDLRDVAVVAVDKRGKGG